jgi:hypothetical protein
MVGNGKTRNRSPANAPAIREEGCLPLRGLYVRRERSARPFVETNFARLLPRVPDQTDLKAGFAFQEDP